MAIQRGGHLNVEAGGVVLAGVQLGVSSPGPAGQEGSINDVEDVIVEMLHCGYPVGGD